MQYWGGKGAERTDASPVTELNTESQSELSSCVDDLAQLVGVCRFVETVRDDSLALVRLVLVMWIQVVEDEFNSPINVGHV